jgi:aspartate kinase
MAEGLSQTGARDRIVLKFGGAALGDGEGVRRAARILARFGGVRPIVVVSAPSGVTRLLDETARAAAGGKLQGELVRVRMRTILRQLELEGELLDRHLSQLFALLNVVRERGDLGLAERDSVLSFGERMSARIVAHFLRRQGIEATPVDAYDLGLRTDSNHGGARPLGGGASSIGAALETIDGVAIVTGFLAVDQRGNLTTLGPDGSDLTAALIGEAVHAREVQFWKPVDGVYSADPALVPEAFVIPELSYSEASEYARWGASVLHPLALEPLERSGVPARIRNVACADTDDSTARPGTAVGPGASRRSGPFGVAARQPGGRKGMEPRDPWIEKGSASAALVGSCENGAEIVQSAHAVLRAEGIDVRAELAGVRCEAHAFIVAEGQLADAVRTLHVHFVGASPRSAAP